MFADTAIKKRQILPLNQTSVSKNVKYNGMVFNDFAL